MKKYVMAFDAGTNSTRAILFDRTGNIVAMAAQEFRQARLAVRLERWESRERFGQGFRHLLTPPTRDVGFHAWIVFCLDQIDGARTREIPRV